MNTFNINSIPMIIENNYEIFKKEDIILTLSQPDKINI
jgi:hypothetical protein